MERLSNSKKGASRSCQSNNTTAASKKEIDERRLRKLKVYLRSVSYNSCEGLPKYPTLPDLYEDTILSEEFPCDTMRLSSRQHCAPTPFLIACCFNRRYPLNARKGNIRGRPANKQDSKKIVMSSSREKSPKQGDNNESPKVQGASERAKEENIHTSDKIEKIHENAAVEREITKKSGSMKIPDLDNCTGSKKNQPEYHRDRKTTCIVETTTENNEASLSTIKERHSRGKTGKEKSSGTKCRENGLEDDNVGNTNEMNELKAVKTTVEEKSERIKKATEKQEQVCGRKEDGFQKNECIKINKTQEEFSDCLANEGRNNDTCIGTSPALNGHSSPQILLAKEQDSIVERQETGNITGKVSQKATVTSQKANTEPGVGHTNMCPKVGNEQKSSERCSQQKQKDEGEIMFNISTDPARRTSSRLATLCNRNTAQPQDKERNVQKRDVKFAEKVNLNVSENSRLRSRALIKQPGHENRYCKAHQSKGK